MDNFGNVGKRSGGDADGRGKRQRLDPTQGDTNTRTTLPTERLTQTWRQAPAANFGVGISASRAEQQNLIDTHRARTAAAVTDPASLYRQGRYVPTEARYFPMPVPEFLRGVSAYGRAQQPQGTVDPRNLSKYLAYDDVLQPPRVTVPNNLLGSEVIVPRNTQQLRIRASQPQSSVPVSQQPPTNPQSSLEVVRVCPQCREVPLGPGPIVNGEPTYPVCEKCRQANIRQQVLQGIAAQALVALSQRVAAHRPRHNDQAEDVRGQACSGLGPVPKTPQLFLCLRCKRPGVPLAPGRRRCTECICILIAFGPDEDEEQSDVNGNQKLQKQQPAGLQSQQQPPDQRWHMCDGCFKKPVPPGERKCSDCVLRSAPKGRTVDLCVICENHVVVQGQSYCGNCEIEGTRGLNASAMDDVMQCNACGDYADRTADGICWDCRMLDASSTAAAYTGHGAVLDEWDLMDTSEDGPSEPQQLIEKRSLWLDRMEEEQLAQESPAKC
ncbi:hypothetical protein ColTof4_09055 [Colletotrichum tofieldiae]|nr:hypothetical protein ColTof3_03738 [Colletotrichum tofieldiae]GKT76632.1 hypothetical protein ColTof4_09055 [Colletotrichum tofieldiae]